MVSNMGLTSTLNRQFRLLAFCNMILSANKRTPLCYPMKASWSALLLQREDDVMKRFLLTAMSGTGQFTVIRKLTARRYKAVDADGDEFSQRVFATSSGNPGSPYARILAKKLP